MSPPIPSRRSRVLLRRTLTLVAWATLAAACAGSSGTGDRSLPAPRAATSTCTTAGPTTTASDPPDSTATTSSAAASDPAGGAAATAAAATTAAAVEVAPDPAARAVFPLRVVPGTRHLVDAAGRPFLMQGEAAWSLIAELRPDEVDRYLADRRARGFTTLLVSLLERRFARNAPANIAGDPPFLVADDYATPNEAYFSYADQVLARAEEEGFLVLLTPSYTGWIGGGEGWWDAMVANGPDKLRDYGEYVARRFASRRNIVWVQGGDGDPPQRELVDALAAGIAAGAPGVLQTVHTNRDTLPLDYWPDRAWVELNNVYTYEEVYDPVRREYDRSPLPLFFMEGLYENEHGVSTATLRTQAYHAYLAGGMGQIFGNNPIWHFSGPGIGEPEPGTWEEQLDSPGSRSMSVLAEILASRPWWRLVPDDARPTRLLRDGVGKGDERAAAAVACDGTLALVYAPSGRRLGLDTAAMAPGNLRYGWIDPSSGVRVEVPQPEVGSDGTVTLETPGRNSGNDDDWVLEVTAA